MELVTEPVIHDAETAMKFAKELQLLLRYLGASDANMDKGEMRVEANISISKTETFGTKVEVKNINSFKSVGDAIKYEIKRHAEVLDRGEAIIQETRGWDENAGKTFSQRKKETAHDYRYFPDPDLPKLKISEIPEFKDIAKTLPELPWERRARFMKEYALIESVAELYVSNIWLGDFFAHVVVKLGNDLELAKLASNYISSDYAALLKSPTGEITATGNITEDTFAALIQMIKKNELSSRGAKDTLAIMWKEGGDPKAIAQKHGLVQKSDPEALKKMCKEIITANEKVVTEYKAGKESSLQFLIGQGMKASKGSANPQMLGELFKVLLS